jgi:Mn-dependent DtxR family transcriptional regulator/DNA-binding MarR family transcriptional regulator
MPNARNFRLTQSQAACLIALRHRKDFQPKVAIEAKLAIAQTATALRALARLGLAQHDQTKRWHATSRGKTCRIKTVPDRPWRNHGLPGPGGRRLLELLDRPMRGREIGARLQITPQRVRQLLIKLHALGCVKFGDPENPFWIVMRAGDKTSLLSYDEERVLSVIPREYATDATKIRLAARMPESKVQQILERLLIRRFIETSDGPRGDRVYRITIAGLKHPQCSQSASHAQARRLPVESDRIRQVLSAILDSGELRIKDVASTVRIPHQSINALMQYLKRKRLVKKKGRQLHSPYSLTAQGLAVLAEMTRREAA